MNNKLLSYEDAVKELKNSVEVQVCFKKLSKIKQLQKPYMKYAFDNKNKINLILSIIAAHKLARKLYGKLNHV